MRVAAKPSWTCPGCGKRRATAFCPACGEERLRPRDLKVDDIAARLAGAFSNVDGRLLRSFRALLARPGSLTADYVAGRRRLHLGPLQLFLIANALFFALQSLTGIEIFSSPLGSHLNNQDWSETARAMVAARLAATGRTLAAFAPAFDRAAIWNAKALIILMALAFAPVIALLQARQRRPFGAHVVFALHLYAFILLLMCFALLLAWGERLAGGDGLVSPRVDLALSLFNLAAAALYIYWAARAYYGGGRLVGALRAALLAGIVGLFAVGYRFVIFLITLWTT
jgi:hypothetical protein